MYKLYLAEGGFGVGFEFYDRLLTIENDMNTAEESTLFMSMRLQD